ESWRLLHIAHWRLARHWVDGAFFFFSSRRRHTRLVSDWSSDVCSSDLRCAGAPSRGPRRRAWSTKRRARRRRAPAPAWPRRRAQIGRASCRERGEIAVVAGGVKKKSGEEGEEDMR